MRRLSKKSVFISSICLLLIGVVCVFCLIFFMERIKQKIKAEELPAYIKEIPLYYKELNYKDEKTGESVSYLDKKISEIPEGSSFIFITDTHWAGNAKHSTQLIRYIRDNTGIKKVLFGGDILGKASSAERFKVSGGSYLLESREAFGSDYIPCVGDHDNNTVNVPDLATCYVPFQEMSHLFVGDLEGKNEYHYYDASEKLSQYCSGKEYEEMMAFFKTVYYIDDVEENIRFIVLNCGNAGKYGAPYTVFGGGSTLLRLQFDWLVDTLMSTPEKMNVCVLSHKGAFDSSSARILMSMLTEFKLKNPNWKPWPATAKNKNVESWWSHLTTYDFSGAPDIGLLFTLNGHTHRNSILWAGYDEDGEYQRGVSYDRESVLDQVNRGQIPHIFTATDSVRTANEVLKMTEGTITEQCFDVVTLVEDGIALTRVGAGEDRKISIKW